MFPGLPIRRMLLIEVVPAVTCRANSSAAAPEVK